MAHRQWTQLKYILQIHQVHKQFKNQTSETPINDEPAKLHIKLTVGHAIGIFRILAQVFKKAYEEPCLSYASKL